MVDEKGTWGGRRIPGPGKSLGRSPKYDTPMQQKTIRLPEDWIEKLVAEFGAFQWAIEALAAIHLGQTPKIPDKNELETN